MRLSNKLMNYICADTEIGESRQKNMQCYNKAGIFVLSIVPGFLFQPHHGSGLETMLF